MCSQWQTSPPRMRLKRAASSSKTTQESNLQCCRKHFNYSGKIQTGAGAAAGCAAAEGTRLMPAKGLPLAVLLAGVSAMPANGFDAAGAALWKHAPAAQFLVWSGFWQRIVPVRGLHARSCQRRFCLHVWHVCRPTAEQGAQLNRHPLACYSVELEPALAHAPSRFAQSAGGRGNAACAPPRLEDAPRLERALVRAPELVGDALRAANTGFTIMTGGFPWLPQPA